VELRLYHMTHPILWNCVCRLFLMRREVCVCLLEREPTESVENNEVSIRTGHLSAKY